MAARSVDPERVRSAAARLAAVRDRGHLLDDDLLAHLVVLGEREVQVAVDGALEQAADTMRALTAQAAELALGLESAARREPEADGDARRATEATRSGLRRPRRLDDRV